MILTLFILSCCLLHSVCSRKWAALASYIDGYAFYNCHDYLQCKKSTGPNRLIHEGVVLLKLNNLASRESQECPSVSWHFIWNTQGLLDDSHFSVTFRLVTNQYRYQALTCVAGIWIVRKPEGSNWSQTASKPNVKPDVNAKTKVYCN